MQLLEEQSWNAIVPLSVAGGSENVAESCGVMRPRTATEPSTGTAGAVVSSVKLRGDDQAERLPAASCARARQ